MARSAPKNGNASSATIGFEAKLWLAADKLRSNMDAAEYKHVVLGLIFLKYISDVSKGRVEETPALLPPPSWPNGFRRRLAHFSSVGFPTSIQSRTVATLRDTLLPKLVSGELSVAKAVLSSEKK